MALVGADGSQVQYSGTLTGGGFQGTASAAGRTVDVVGVAAAPAVQRLINISSRARVGSGDNIIIAGFVVTGSKPKDLLVRAVGPGLTQFGVTGPLANPVVRVLRGSETVLENDDWDASGTIGAVSAETGARVGAFPLSSGSKDAAMFTALTPGLYTAQISGNGGEGVSLVEIYDATSFSPDAPRVVNISTRAQVGTGADILIAGFVVDGTSAKKVLVRAAGPALGGFGLTTALADPQLKLYRDGILVAENDNWSTESADLISAAAAKVGAFAFAPASKDAAMLIYLPPGVYSAQVSGVEGVTGVALVEIYEVIE